jgi:hypothetical protein
MEQKYRNIINKKPHSKGIDSLCTTLFAARCVRVATFYFNWRTLLKFRLSQEFPTGTTTLNEMAVGDFNT